jgi:peroxiredoxin
VLSKSRYFLFLLALTAGVYFYYVSRHSEGIQKGDSAPVFTLPSLEGSASLERYRGKTVLLNFWATWCPPCIQEMPSLEALHRRFAGKNFQVLTINLDERPQNVEFFLKRTPLTFPILFDPHGDVAALYSTYQLPETYLIDPKGRVLKKYIGPQDWLEQDIVQEIESYVEKP